LEILRSRESSLFVTFRGVMIECIDFTLSEHRHSQIVLALAETNCCARLKHESSA